MTNEEKFIFDLDGYIVIKNVLSKDEVDELNAVADEAYASKDEETRRRLRRCSLWGKPFQNLLDNANILPYLVEMLGPKFRADHDYAIFMQSGQARRGGLHGGEWGGAHGGEMDHWYRYRDGVMRNGLTVVSFFTMPAREGDGGFACIPGSHKSHFLRAIPSDVRSFDRRPHYVRQPAVEAGDALIFTEALVHGTMPWTAEHERRSFLYKYSPGHSAWQINYYDLDAYEGLTDQQKRLMMPPVGSRPDVIEASA